MTSTFKAAKLLLLMAGLPSGVIGQTPASPSVVVGNGLMIRTPLDRTTDVVNVKDFGAKGDGVADDSAAINAAIAYLRSARRIGDQISGHLVIPQGRYLIRSTIDATGIRSSSVEIDGDGAVLVAKIAGKPVVDALGSRFLRIRDLAIEGDANIVPTIGLQIGRIDNTAGDSSDNIMLDAVFISGSFSFTALYNLNAETSTFVRLNLWNNYASSNSYCLVQDGLNHWRAHSDFVVEKAPLDTPQSFNENLFLSADIRHTGGGTPIWIAQTSRHQFVNSYVANTKGGNAIALYSAANTDQNLMLDLDMHVETSSVTDALILTGPNPHPIIAGLRLRDHYSFATKSLLKADRGISGITLSGARIEIGAFASPSARVFAQPALWSGNADVTLQSPVYWNGTDELDSIVRTGAVISLKLKGDVSTNNIRISGPPPQSRSESCAQGQIRADSNYIYFCTKTNEWKRAALNAW